MTELEVDAEAETRAALEAGERNRATTILLTAYGPELLGFLFNRLGDQTAAETCFAELAERIWRKLGQLQWRTTARAWCYAVARTAVADYRRKPEQQAHRRVDLADAPEVLTAVHRVRTATRPYLRTTVKRAFSALRDELSEADQIMVGLRLDRELSWKELAQAMADVELDGPALDREAARLRKRFETVKTEFAQKAQQRGLLDRVHD